MKRADTEQQHALDGPGSQPDYSGPMPADIAEKLEAEGVEIRVPRETADAALPADDADAGDEDA